MTRRIEPSENINQITTKTLLLMTQRCLIEITFFFKKKNMTHRNWTFFTWLKELNPFLNMTQRIEKISWFFDSKNWTYFEYDSKIWIFSWMWLTELNFFIDSKKWVLFFRMTKIFVEYNSKNRTFVWICLQELNLFWNFTQWIEHSAQKDSKNWTLKDYLNNKTFLWIGESIWLKELNFFSKISLKNYWPFFDMTHRIELLFRTWLTELNFFFKNMTHWDWTLLFFLSQRKWLLF